DNIEDDNIEDDDTEDDDTEDDNIEDDDIEVDIEDNHGERSNNDDCQGEDNCQREKDIDYIQLALFKVFPEVPEIKTNAGTKIAEWKKNPQVSEAYNRLWEVDDNELTTINTIIMKTMPKESKEDCVTPTIIAFALAVCCIVLNPHGKDIRCAEDAIKKHYDSRDGSKANDYDDNEIEELPENDINEDARLFE
ncbi:2156_t:CDS:2, partial [Racocetra persica]